MSPIANLSDIVRIPRLGKIRLGIKVEQPGKHPYPKPTDYFVVPPEIADVFGDKPKELDIMFPMEDSSQFAQQWLRAYSMTQGLTCVGDGITSRRKVDTATGAMASHETVEWIWKDDMHCDPQDCPEFLKKRCRRVMNLQVLIPVVPGLGVWQIDTSSFYSIVNINSMISLLKAILGRCSMIPLTLALGPIEVSPLGQKKKTVYIMHIKKNIKLSDLAKVALLPPAQALIPPPEVEEAPADLYPEEVLAEAEPGAEVKSLSGPPPAPEPGAEAEPMPEEAWERLVEEESPQPESQNVAWNIVKALLNELKPKEGLVTQWFQKHFSVSVNLADFDSEKPPDKITEQMLKQFHNSLLATKEAKAKTPK
ncbi:MAG TPA: hypothetical protein VMX96_09485 [Dehalococcoidia bacterium]|nr:hypothetical protein [Dehalococcoidia bacterium]